MPMGHCYRFNVAKCVPPPPPPPLPPSHACAHPVHLVFACTQTCARLEHTQHTHTHTHTHSPNFNLAGTGGMMRLTLDSSIVAEVCWALDLTLGFSVAQGVYLDMSSPVELEYVFTYCCSVQKIPFLAMCSSRSSCL